MSNDASNWLDELHAEIHFKENSIPSIHAGKLTDKTKAAIIARHQEELREILEALKPDGRNLSTSAYGLWVQHELYKLLKEDWFERPYVETIQAIKQLLNDSTIDKRPRLPWAAKVTGGWNGDMFADWYREEPQDSIEYQLWRFLHEFEQAAYERGKGISHD